VVYLLSFFIYASEPAVPFAVSLHIVTDWLKALRNSGHAVPQQDDATALW
jgi:hypothetical protein